MQYSEAAVLIRLLIGALATFFAILVWSRTRNPAWILMVVGILIHYIQIVSATLEEFGIITEKIYNIGGVPVIKTILVNLPLLFFTLGMIIFITRKKL